MHSRHTHLLAEKFAARSGALVGNPGNEYAQKITPQLTTNTKLCCTVLKRHIHNMTS